jgi:hypothetical protein
MDKIVDKVIFLVLCLLAWGLYYLHDAGILGSTLTMFKGFFGTHLREGGIALAFFTILGIYYLFSDDDDAKGSVLIVALLGLVVWGVYHFGWQALFELSIVVCGVVAGLLLIAGFIPLLVELAELWPASHAAKGTWKDCLKAAWNKGWKAAVICWAIAIILSLVAVLIYKLTISSTEQIKHFYLGPDGKIHPGMRPTPSDEKTR